MQVIYWAPTKEGGRRRAFDTLEEAEASLRDWAPIAAAAWAKDNPPFDQVFLGKGGEEREITAWGAHLDPGGKLEHLEPLGWITREVPEVRFTPEVILGPPTLPPCLQAEFPAE